MMRTTFTREPTVRATDILKQEHRVIERVLTALETAAGRLQAGASLDPSFFIQASDFIKGFADGCHHQKEEGILFPAMQAAGIPSQGGPVEVMLAEHMEGRRLTTAMRAAAERLQSGDAGARDPLVRSALDYVALLRQHIAKEDNVLFPVADHAIDAASQARVAAAFEEAERQEIGDGVHERFLALAESLERQAAG